MLNPGACGCCRAVLCVCWLQVYYLPASAFKEQLTAITETAVAGSRLFFDYITLSAMSGETFMPGFETLWLVRGLHTGLYLHIRLCMHTGFYLHP